MSKPRILIIGAGASGMMAAHTAAKYGAIVTVIDHNSEAGKKLLITGNGKCNFTNTDVSPRHYHSSEFREEASKLSYFRQDERISLLRHVLEAFSYNDCISFFNGIGITEAVKYFRFDDTGYVYPECGAAAAVRDSLYNACNSLGVRFLFSTDANAVNLQIPNDGGQLHSDIGEFEALIIAAGSNAYPLTGSDSSIYPFIKRLGFKFNTFLPALCALYSKDERLKELKGIRLEGEALLIIDESQCFNSYGEIQFNEHSISGIPVMQLSGIAAIALAEKKSCILRVGGHDFEIYRTAGFDRAQCCSGGISITDIYPDTLMSKHNKGIYVCGELIDIYGDCGGYNLHFAWASGYLAGKNAALNK